VELGTDDDGNPHTGVPALTMGAAFFMGLRIPLEHKRAAATSLLVGLHLARVFDARADAGLFGAGLGLDIVL
jgi:hypothetical protein